MGDLLNRMKREERAAPPQQTDLMPSHLIPIIDDGGRERRMENQLSNLGLDLGFFFFF